MGLIGRNSGILLGAGALLSAILLVIILVAITGKKEEGCKLQSDFTWDGITGLRNLASSDDKNLVNFVGALHVKNSTQPGFLPIMLSGISVKNQQRYSSIEAKSDCSTLTFTFQNDRNYYKSVLGLRMIADTGNGIHENITCEYNIIIREDSYYECKRLEFLKCKRNEILQTDTPTYSLEIYNIDIELDGDPEIIRTGKFSKRQQVCL